MTTLINEIAVNAPIEKVFQALAAMEGLEKLDPNVKKSNVLSQRTSGQSDQG
jgi:hypothetical protein